MIKPELISNNIICEEHKTLKTEGISHLMSSFWSTLSWSFFVINQQNIFCMKCLH